MELPTCVIYIHESQKILTGKVPKLETDKLGLPSRATPFWQSIVEYTECVKR